MKINFNKIFRHLKLALIAFLSWKLWDRFRTAKKDNKNTPDNEKR